MEFEEFSIRKLFLIKNWYDFVLILICGENVDRFLCFLVNFWYIWWYDS